MPDVDRRQFKNSPQHQGVDEKIAYKIDTTPWGGNPSNVYVVITCKGVLCPIHLSGSPSIEGNVIITPKVVDLEEARRYRLEVKWDDLDGNTLEAYGWIVAELR